MLTRLAMWSGPRNISTAMLRAWGSRADCAVVDEPLYAYYLAATGLDHPGRADVLAAQSTQWPVVVEGLTRGPVADGVTVQYQKHMTHHVLPDVPLAAFDGLRHAFLIRDPAEVVASYTRVRSDPTSAELGYERQAELYERFGGPVLDAADVLRDPERSLRRLCAALGLAFDPAMLGWNPGPRPTDGVWGRYWYDAVWASTGFAAYRPSTAVVPERLTGLVEACRPYYETLAADRLR